ncbi:MAG: hypothetical protein WEB13_01805 [Dehalococcoidia bacterium]
MRTTQRLRWAGTIPAIAIAAIAVAAFAPATTRAQAAPLTLDQHACRPSATGAAGLATPAAASIAVVALWTLAAVALVASAREVARRRA